MVLVRPYQNHSARVSSVCHAHHPALEQRARAVEAKNPNHLCGQCVVCVCVCVCVRVFVCVCV